MGLKRVPLLDDPSIDGSAPSKRLKQNNENHAAGGGPQFAAQQHAFWRLVGATIAQTLEQRGERRTWLNTEGSGVPWLHVRIDSSPKYYHHDPYRRGEVENG